MSAGFHVIVQLGSQFYGTFDFTEQPFEWGKECRRPAVGAGELIIYEVRPPGAPCCIACTQQPVSVTPFRIAYTHAHYA